MEKYREVRTKFGYTKYYRYDTTIDPVAFLEELASKGWEFDKVFMKRDAEMDMQFGIGYYTIKELKQQADALANGPACLFTVKAEYHGHTGEIHFDDTSKIVYMVTSEKNFELN